MKIVISILVISAMLTASCSSKSHASRSDKKKVNDYNSIQYRGAKKKN
jgi:ABC-type Fe3+-citrate transport system substrate-binding protein